MAENVPYSSQQHSVSLVRVPEGIVNPNRTSGFAALDITPEVCITTVPVANGGFCLLYRGRLTLQSEEPGIVVAVKVLIRKNAQTDSELAHMRLRVAREAAILRDAQHVLVVEFYGTAIIQGHPALVLRWYKEGDATQALKGKSTAQKLNVIKDIAMGMVYLHSKNIVHGDLKGNNVLINDDGRGILTDFGLSHFTDGHTGCTTSSESCATPWLSPELAILFFPSKSPPTIRTRTMASDVWAFGSTAFELLSEMTPYQGLHKFLILLAISEGVSPLMSSPSTVLNPPEIVGILVQCWQVDPGLRPAMANVVQMLSRLCAS